MTQSIQAIKEPRNVAMLNSIQQHHQAAMAHGLSIETELAAMPLGIQAANKPIHQYMLQCPKAFSSNIRPEWPMA